MRAGTWSLSAQPGMAAKEAAVSWKGIAGGASGVVTGGLGVGVVGGRLVPHEATASAAEIASRAGVKRVDPRMAVSVNRFVPARRTLASDRPLWNRFPHSTKDVNPSLIDRALAQFARRPGASRGGRIYSGVAGSSGRMPNSLPGSPGGTSVK